MPLNISIRPQPATGVFLIEFDQRLHRRGTDFSVYANTGYSPQENDSKLLQQIMKSLMTDFSGVKSVNVECFGLGVSISSAVNPEKLAQMTLAGAKRAGFEATIIDGF